MALSKPIDLEKAIIVSVKPGLLQDYLHRLSALWGKLTLPDDKLKENSFTVPLQQFVDERPDSLHLLTWRTVHESPADASLFMHVVDTKFVATHIISTPLHTTGYYVTSDEHGFPDSEIYVSNPLHDIGDVYRSALELLYAWSNFENVSEANSYLVDALSGVHRAHRLVLPSLDDAGEADTAPGITFFHRLIGYLLATGDVISSSERYEAVRGGVLIAKYLNNHKYENEVICQYLEPTGTPERRNSLESNLDYVPNVHALRHAPIKKNIVFLGAEETVPLWFDQIAVALTYPHLCGHSPLIYWLAYGSVFGDPLGMVIEGRWETHGFNDNFGGYEAYWASTILLRVLQGGCKEFESSLQERCPIHHRLATYTHWCSHAPVAYLSY